MPAPLRQVQLTYSNEEDRLLLRLRAGDQAEYRIWLTRRFSRLLLRVLREQQEADPDVSLQASTEAKAAVRQFKHEQAVAKANFTQAFDPAPATFPLGEQAMLAFRLTARRNGSDLQLGIHPRTGQGVNLAVNAPLGASMTELLLRCLRQADWNLPEVPRAAPLETAGKDVVIN